MIPTFLSFTERHPRYVTFVGISLFIMGFVLYGFYFIASMQLEVQNTEVEAVPQELQESFPKPTKTEFATTTPEGFVSDVPLEEGIFFEQSYSFEYPEQKQLSVVFYSSKSAKENFDLYVNYIQENNWMTLNTYESEKLFSLYAVRENNNLNVTISDESTEMFMRSEVSISVLVK